MGSKSKKGIARKGKKYPGFSTSVPTPSPPNFISTGKQKEVMILLKKGFNIAQMAKYLNINESSVRDRFKSLEKKNLVIKRDFKFYLTKAGKLVTTQAEVYPGMGTEVSGRKNLHAKDFEVPLFRLPKQWENTQFVIQSLTVKDYFYNESAKQLFLYYPDCTIRISHNAKKVSFFIRNQTGNSFDELESKAWDVFVNKFRILKNSGFELGNHVKSSHQEFANKDGFFAKLATKLTDRDFRIDTDAGSFWVDYSDGPSEEETESEEIAKRMEQLANSALSSTSDFTDLDKLKEIVAGLVQLQARSLFPPSQRQELHPQPTTLEQVSYIG